jgi:ribosomal protein S18 acetylase RimI-like enzyme
MMTIMVRGHSFEIRPIAQGELDAVMEVYRQCEDFLALGPVPTASMEMVLKDIEISQAENGIFCGIYTVDEEMVGIIDYVPAICGGNPQAAFLELLMIAAPFRNQGLGKAVVEAVENEIRKDVKINTILSGVQVNNPQAVQFWQRNGYQIVSEPRLLPDQTTAVELRKDLDRMKKIEKLESLAHSVDMLISEIQKTTIASSYLESLLNVLQDLQSRLAGKDEINFKQSSFAIFRVVTDDYNLEKSDLGQKLLGLSVLLQEIGKSDNSQHRLRKSVQ